MTAFRMSPAARLTSAPLRGAAARRGSTSFGQPRGAAARSSARGTDPTAYDDEEDFFDLLESTPADSAEVIRDNYRRLQKRLHPDVAGDSAAAVARSAALNVAFEVLNDPARRAAYTSGASLPGARRGVCRRQGAGVRREGLVGPLRQQRLLATLLPRRAAGTERLTGEEVRDAIRDWAKTLAFCSELPLPLPLQIDELPTGVRIAFVRMAPGGGLAPVGELVFDIQEDTESCIVHAETQEEMCDWRATVLRRWPSSADELGGPLPGEERVLSALRREFEHLIRVGDDDSAKPFSAYMPSWMAAMGAWMLPALPLLGLGGEPSGGDYASYRLQRSCRLGADGRRPPHSF